MNQNPWDSYQTLFFETGTNASHLLIREGKRRKQVFVKHASPHAALDWCIEHKCAFVCLPRPTPETN